MCSAAACITFTPTSVEPVNETLATRGSAIRAPAVVEPGPGTTLSVPSGRPHSYRISAIASVVSGVWLAGFTTAVFPHASAGAIFQLAITAGKFHGVMRAHTPTGSRSVRSMPGGTIGIVSPVILLAAPPQYSKTLAAMSISARAEEMGLPPLRASSVASSSWRSRITIETFVSRRPRSRALMRGHAPASKARCARSTARVASSAPPDATSRMDTAVAGSITSSVAPSAASTRSPPITSVSAIVRSSFVHSSDVSFYRSGRSSVTKMAPFQNASNRRG